MSVINKNHLPVVWIVSASSISVVLVAMTALSALDVGPSALIHRLSLTNENNVGAWWSGTLLALASIHAFDGYVRWQQSKPGIARAWASIAILLMLLSADEVGSIHERVALFGDSIGVGSVPALLPAALILVVMLSYALILLWSDEGQRRKVLPIAIAFGLFAFVALQEVIEHAIDWQSGGAKAIRAAIEEGTELVGILILLRVTMSNVGGLFVRTGPPTGPVFEVSEAAYRLRTLLIVFGVATSLFLAFVTAYLLDQHRGRPADWFSAVMFLLAAIAVSRRYFAEDADIGWRAWTLVVFCLLASIVAVGIPPVKIVDAGWLSLNLRGLIFSFGILLMCGIGALFPRAGRTGYSWLGVVVLGLLLAFSTDLMLAYSLTQVTALVVCFQIRGWAAQSSQAASDLELESTTNARRSLLASER